MTLIACKECGGEVSTKANACPKCGAKQKLSLIENMAIGGLIGYILAPFFLLAIIYFYHKEIFGIMFWLMGKIFFSIFQR